MIVGVVAQLMYPQARLSSTAETSLRPGGGLYSTEVDQVASKIRKVSSLFFCYHIQCPLFSHSKHMSCIFELE